VIRYFLWSTAAVFLGFGFWGLFDPVAMVAKFGIELNDPSGRTLVRASYGGFLIGAGFLFGWCATSHARFHFGLIAVIALTLPILISRLIGIAVDGGASVYHIAYAIIELLGVVIATLLLKVATLK
jgi:hypothetical protein